MKQNRNVTPLPIEIEALLMPFDFLVVEDLPVNCILGTDFMSFSSCVIDFTKQIVQFCDNVNMLKPFDVSPDLLALIQTLKIQPRSEYFVPVSVQNSDLIPHQTTQMMVNPLPRNYKQLFFVTNSIVTVPPDGKFVILLINSSDRSFEIKAERILAFLTPITPDIVLVLLNDSEKVTYDFKTVTPAYDNFVGFGQQRQDYQRNFVTPPTSQNQHLFQW